MESFYTIQGEGFHQGKAAYFIRLAGCDVGCVWCDVKESWDASKHPIIEISKIVDEAKKFPARITVITGGEPLIYDLTTLTSQLRQAGFRTHIETSGAYPVSGIWDWICLSPKKFMKPKVEICNLADELKVVVYNKSDFDWAEEYKAKMKPLCKLYLQPEWSREKEMMPAIVDYIKQKPEWEISLQIHKYLNIP
jgi:organic radical activating enzyme